ncbi:MAG: ArsR/SmtB family transcription factor [Candidatus Woesearchaeota archaeon]
MIQKVILKSCHAQGYDEQDIYGAYKIFFGTLFSEPRLRILSILRKGKKNVTELMEETGLSQTSMSHNLSRLRKCGFITRETKGKYRYYHINDKTIGPMLKLIDNHMMQYCMNILKERDKS